MKRTWLKRCLWIVSLAVVVIAVSQFTAVWLAYRVLYGPEQQLVQLTSPDGEQVAHFSVKYEGAVPWWPAHPQPHFYITVTDADSGKLLLRETDFEWPGSKSYRSTTDSFTRLARVYAPWAEQHFQSDISHSTSEEP